MSNVGLKEIQFGGVTMKVPEVWVVETELYTEPDRKSVV